MFSKLFARFLPQKIEDPLFGSLVFMNVPKPGRRQTEDLSYWEAEQTSCGFGNPIDLIIDARSSEHPPTDAQRAFFMRVQSDYLDLCLVAETFFRDDLWAVQMLESGFHQEFKLGGLHIPLCEQSDEEWEMTFDAHSDPEHIFSVIMAGPRKGHVSVDG
jgi:hypothetical protein